MMDLHDTGFVEQVALTVLVDNKANLIVESSETVKYFTNQPLLAEHGFAVLIQTSESDKKILWDAGVSKIALIENMRRMSLDFQDISLIALSHGHMDHFAALTALLGEMNLKPEPRDWEAPVNQGELEDWLAGFQVPIVSHPAAFRERWLKKDDGTLRGPSLPPPEQEWKAAGAKTICSQGPYQLARGCWTTGFVPRTSFEKSGRPTKLFFRDGSDFVPDDLEEDQAIVIHVKDKGLVVLPGCAHSGIVNTVRYASEFTRIGTVYAIIGGFHLAEAKDDEINKTIDYLKKLNPTYIIPSHCTGFRAESQIAQAMPEAFIESVVGAKYTF